jgi:sorting nexin-8
VLILYLALVLVHYTPIIMFNAPRRGTQQLSSSAFISSSSGSSYPDPLAQSTPNVGYGEVDPWSAVPSPARIATPRTESQEVVTTAPANTAGATGAGRAGLNAFFSE